MVVKKEIIYNSIKFILFFGMLTWGIYFVLTQKTVLNALKIGFQNEVENEYSGVIKVKYNDHSNHNSPKIVFTNGKLISINSAFRSQMEVGDSINKVKGDSIIQVFRGGKRIHIEIAPFYRAAIQNEIEKKKR